MSRFAFVAAVYLVPFVSVGAYPPPKPAKTDADLIQGVWEWDPTAKQSDAKPQVLLEHLVIKDDKLTFHYNFEGNKSTSPTEFKLDPTTSPKQIDFTPTEGGNKGKTYLGLYEITAGQLKICYRGPGASRPKDFDDKLGRNTDDNTNSVTSFLVLKK